MNAGNFAGIDSLDKHFEQISFRLCVLFTEHRQLKGWQHLFQPTVAKSSISTMVHWFAAVTCHNWKRNILKSKSWIPQLYLLYAWCKHSAEPLEPAAALRDLKLFGMESRQFVIASWPLLNENVGPTFARCHDATTNGLGDHKPKRSKRLLETSLWQAWVRVAWTERGQQISGTENLRRRIIRIHHWFTTQISTLAFELNCDSQLNNPLLPTLWSLHELNVLAKMNTGNLAGMDSLDKRVKEISFPQWVTFGEHRQLKGWQPLFQPTVAKSWMWMCTIQHGFDAVAIQDNQDHNQYPLIQILDTKTLSFWSILHSATIMWSVLPLSGTSSFW